MKKVIARFIRDIYEYEKRRNMGDLFGGILAKIIKGFDWEEWDEMCNLEPL